MLRFFLFTYAATWAAFFGATAWPAQSWHATALVVPQPAFKTPPLVGQALGGSRGLE